MMGEWNIMISSRPTPQELEDYRLECEREWLLYEAWMKRKKRKARK